MAVEPPEDPGYDPGPPEPVPPDNVVALAGRKPRPKAKPRGDWRDGFRLTTNDRVAATVANIDLVLRNDAAYAGKLRRNSMNATDEIDSVTLTDEGYTGVRIDMERRFDFAPSKEDVGAAIARVAAERSYHPVADYLRGLVWDRELRIERFLRDVLKAPVTPLYQAMVRRWFTATVARPLRPGCKVDTMLVLVGPQGARKSTLFRTLSSPWFVDSSVNLDTRDAYMVLGLSWIAEWAELDVVTKASRERVKGFLSSPEDCYRAPYARAVIRVLRTQTIVGTTNAEEFLGDPTGSRRFWPIPVGAINLELAAAWRDQLWAEAVANLDAGEPWWLDEAEETARAADAAQWEQSDPWAEPLLSWCSGKAPFTSREALEDGCGLKPRDVTKAAEMRAADILRRAGYGSHRASSSTGRQRKWSLPTAGQPGQPQAIEVVQVISEQLQCIAQPGQPGQPI